MGVELIFVAFIFATYPSKNATYRECSCGGLRFLYMIRASQVNVDFSMTGICRRKIDVSQVLVLSEERNHIWNRL